MKQGKIILGVLTSLLLFSVPVFSQNAKWKAPASSDKLVNPLAGKVSADGKKIYESMCVICHGEKGKGNGAAGLTLTPRPANFLAINVRSETDGNILWKLTEGNPPMASYKTLLSETQRWQLVNYIRQLEGSAK